MIQFPGEWVIHAACAGVNPDLFFPERGDSTREAKAICRRCDVRKDCLDYAMRNGERFGIWGGTSERERRRLRRGKPARSAADYSTLTYAVRAEIVRRANLGAKQVDLADEYDLAANTVSDIVRRARGEVA